MSPDHASSDTRIRRSVRVGIVGVGIGAAVQIPAFHSIPEVIISGLADGGSGRSSALADGLNPRPRIFDCAEDLITDNSIDLVSLAVPPASQHTLSELAINHHKRILCEKPFGLDRQRALVLAEKARKMGVKTAVSYQFRYEAGILALKEILSAGTLGTIGKISVKWHTSGGRNPNKRWSWRDSIETSTGVLGEFCTHVFDYTSALLKAPIVQISCRESRAIKSRPDQYGNETNVFTSDSCEIDCRFGNGCVGQFSITNAATVTTGHEIKIYGSLGVAIFHHRPPFNDGDASVRVATAGNEGAILLPTDAAPPPLDRDSRIRAFALLISDFINDRTGEYPDFFEAANIHKVLAAARMSARTGQSAEV